MWVEESSRLLKTLFVAKSQSWQRHGMILKIVCKPQENFRASFTVNLPDGEAE